MAGRLLDSVLVNTPGYHFELPIADGICGKDKGVSLLFRIVRILLAVVLLPIWATMYLVQCLLQLLLQPFPIKAKGGGRGKRRHSIIPAQYREAMEGDNEKDGKEKGEGDAAKQKYESTRRKTFKIISDPSFALSNIVEHYKLKGSSKPTSFASSSYSYSEFPHAWPNSSSTLNPSKRQDAPRAENKEGGNSESGSGDVEAGVVGGEPEKKIITMTRRHSNKLHGYFLSKVA